MLIAKGIHRLPEAVVEERLDLALFDQGFHGFALEHPFIILYFIEHSWRQNKESAIDPATLVLGFSWKA